MSLSKTDLMLHLNSWYIIYRHDNSSAFPKFIMSLFRTTVNTSSTKQSVTHDIIGQQRFEVITVYNKIQDNIITFRNLQVHTS